jgi:hypothetical protein
LSQVPPTELAVAHSVSKSPSTCAPGPASQFASIDTTAGALAATEVPGASNASWTSRLAASSTRKTTSPCGTAPAAVEANEACTAAAALAGTQPEAKRTPAALDGPYTATPLHAGSAAAVNTTSTPGARNVSVHACAS